MDHQQPESDTEMPGDSEDEYNSGGSDSEGSASEGSASEDESGGAAAAEPGSEPDSEPDPEPDSEPDEFDDDEPSTGFTGSVRGNGTVVVAKRENCPCTPTQRYGVPVNTSASTSDGDTVWITNGRGQAPTMPLKVASDTDDVDPTEYRATASSDSGAPKPPGGSSALMPIANGGWLLDSGQFHAITAALGPKAKHTRTIQRFKIDSLETRAFGTINGNVIHCGPRTKSLPGQSAEVASFYMLRVCADGTVVATGYVIAVARKAHSRQSRLRIIHNLAREIMSEELGSAEWKVNEIAPSTAGCVSSLLQDAWTTELELNRLRACADAAARNRKVVYAMTNPESPVRQTCTAAGVPGDVVAAVAMCLASMQNVVDAIADRVAADCPTIKPAMAAFSAQVGNWQAHLLDEHAENRPSTDEEWAAFAKKHTKLLKKGICLVFFRETHQIDNLPEGDADEIRHQFGKTGAFADPNLIRCHVANLGQHANEQMFGAPDSAEDPDISAHVDQVTEMAMKKLPGTDVPPADELMAIVDDTMRENEITSDLVHIKALQALVAVIRDHQKAANEQAAAKRAEQERDAKRKLDEMRNTVRRSARTKRPRTK